MAHDPHPPSARRVPADAVAAPRHTLAERLRPEHLYRAAGLLFLLALAYRFFDEVARTLLLIYAAAILAVVLNALRRRLSIQRKWMAALVGIVVVGGLVLGIAFGGPLLMTQVRSVVSTGPALAQQVQQWEQQIEASLGIPIQIPRPGSLMGGPGGAADVMGRATRAAEMLFVPVIIFFGALFALGKPNDRLLTPALRALPHGLRLAWYRVFQLLAERLVGWFKGTLISMAAVGTLSVLALWLIGVPNALALGLFNGLVEFVPLLGPWVGGIVATLVALLDDPQKGLWVAIAMLAIQQIESNLITPFAMSRAAEVHPFVTLFALVLFGGLFGFLGIFLAIPLVLLSWTLVQVLWVERAIDTDRERVEPVAQE